MAGVKRFLGSWLLLWSLVMFTELVRADRLLRVHHQDDSGEREINGNRFSIWSNGIASYHHVWPELEFGCKVVVGTIIGFFGAAMGSVGGVGGGGIFVPMLFLIIGFDPKSSTAISKCMIMGAAGTTVYYNLKQRHPTLDLPMIDYDLALLFQPMLMLGISIGVLFNTIFADWMLLLLLILLFLGTSIKALLKGIDTWKQETIMKVLGIFHFQEAVKRQSKLSDDSVQEYKPLLTAPDSLLSDEVQPNDNGYWKDFMLLAFVWVAFVAIQIAKTYTAPCSVEYWIINSMQVPISISVSLYEAICLYKGKREFKSIGKEITDWKVHQFVLYCCFGIIAGVVGGLLGLGGGFILGPLFLELGVPPQVASATSTFAMAFSSSMSVIQYYLLKRFPVPYAAYLVLVAIIAAFTGQHIVRKLIMILGRASLIIFILSLMIFMSAVGLGGVGIADIIEKLGNDEHMGFQSLCFNT